MENQFKRKQIEYFLRIKINQVIDASKRTIYPYAGIVIFSFILFSHVYVSIFGWTKNQMRDIDESITNSIDGFRAASTCNRVNRYHDGLLRNIEIGNFPLSLFFELGIPIDDYKGNSDIWKKDTLALRAKLMNWLSSNQLSNNKLNSADSLRIQQEVSALMSFIHNNPKEIEQKIKQQLKIEYQAISVLEKERQNLIDQRSREQTVEVPIIGIYMNLGDIGVLGHIGLALLLIFYYACVRRELHALNEFIILVPEKKETGGKRKFIILNEPNFSPQHYFLAFESFSQYFIFISSTKRLKLQMYNIILVFFPTAVVLPSLILDGLDLYEHYDILNLGSIFRLGAQILLTLYIIRLNWRNYRTQLSVTKTLRAFRDLSKGYIGNSRFQDATQEIVSNEHKIVNGVVELVEEFDLLQRKILIHPIDDEEMKKKIIETLPNKGANEMFVWGSSKE